MRRVRSAWVGRMSKGLRRHWRDWRVRCSAAALARTRDNPALIRDLMESGPAGIHSGVSTIIGMIACGRIRRIRNSMGATAHWRQRMPPLVGSCQRARMITAARGRPFRAFEGNGDGERHIDSPVTGRNWLVDGRSAQGGLARLEGPSRQAMLGVMLWATNSPFDRDRTRGSAHPFRIVDGGLIPIEGLRHRRGAGR